MKIILLIFLLIFKLSSSFAEDNGLEDNDSTSHFATSEKIKFIFSGSLDARFISTQRQENWANGGRGITRYGDLLGKSNTEQFKFPQATLIIDTVPIKGISSHIQLNLSDHQDFSTSRRYDFGLVKAHLKYENWSKSFNAKMGVLIPSISLENFETGWNNAYTISNSAINSWVGEEVRVLGAEFTYKVKQWFVTGTAFGGNDVSGAILSWRGWALHDYQAVYGSALKIQSVPEPLSPTSWTFPFEEIDGNLGYYISTGYHSPFFSLIAFYYDNKGDPEGNINGVYSWKTEFKNISIRWNYQDKFELLAQFLNGTTGMGKNKEAVDNKFNAFYVMPTFKWKNKHRVIFRYDHFTVEDVDSWKTDSNASNGTAYTIGYSYQWRHFAKVFVEFIQVDSKRIGNEPNLDNDPKDNLFQANLRFSY